jgi:hypothetical protein
LYGNAKDVSTKWKTYGKMMSLTEKVKEFVWEKNGNVKNLHGNVKDV